MIEQPFEEKYRGVDLSKVEDKGSILDTQVGGSHYKRMAIQPVEFCVKNKIPFLESNVIKYVCRHEYKNGLEDIEKAIQYLKMIKEFTYGGT